jgi:tetratricopeptide (TPR) repeat protein
MAEEILNLLVRVPGLKVIGRTSSFQLKASAGDPERIGTALNAAYVVEGSVRRTAERVRVTAKLLTARDGVQRWSNSYDRDVHDVLEVQEEIAASLVRALQMEVNSASYLPRRGTLPSTEAYEIYLRGYHAHDQYSPAGLEEAVADFRHALELDPTFVPAAEMLAMTLRNQAAYGFVDVRTGYANARLAAEHALALDPRSGLAHALLGGVAIEHDWDWETAKREFRAALSLSPNEPNVLIFASSLPLARGDYAEGLRLIELSLDADPLDSGNTISLGLAYLSMERYAEAERAFRHSLEIAPAETGGHAFVALARLLQQKPLEALAEAQQEPFQPEKLQLLALCNHALAHDKESDANLARLQFQHATDAALSIAQVYAFRGQADAAFHWLDKAYVQKDVFLWGIKGDVLLRRLASDARYKAFLRRMNLPE